MAKFKIGDRVRVVQVYGDCGKWFNDSVGKVGVVQDDDELPRVVFENGYGDCGEEQYLELVEPKKPKGNPLTTSMNAELTHITIGGKRFRLVAED